MRHQSIDYDAVDWDEKWDQGLDRDDEDKWFDEEEESDALNGEGVKDMADVPDA